MIYTCIGCHELSTAEICITCERKIAARLKRTAKQIQRIARADTTPIRKLYNKDTPSTRATTTRMRKIDVNGER